MKKRRLKKYVIPTILMVLGILTMSTSIIIDTEKKGLKPNNLNYVSSTIISQDLAVINTVKKTMYPYTDHSVKIGKSYYDYKASEEEQEKSIIYHENTYIQNSGIDFVYEQPFDIIAILDGTVTNVKEDEVLGKIVEVSHNNEYISVYQSLSEVNVKKGDIISQGHIIGKSGSNTLDKTLGNHLHFELYIGGQVVNPLDYLDKAVNDKTE